MVLIVNLLLYNMSILTALISIEKILDAGTEHNTVWSSNNVGKVSKSRNCNKGSNTNILLPSFKNQSLKKLNIRS